LQEFCHTHNQENTQDLRKGINLLQKAANYWPSANSYELFFDRRLLVFKDKQELGLAV
jgi:hypothetical protein